MSGDAMQGIREGLKQILQDQHATMREVIEGLDVDALNWVPGPEMNSITVLFTHLMGAENSMTATLMGETVNRNRDAEFQTQTPDAETLRRRIDEVEGAVLGRVDRLTLESLAEMHSPANDRLNRRHLGSWWIFHAIEHNREHIGQALITRQLYEQRQQSGA
jgi:uncharacterized damage-inducible protein DinB